MNASLGGKLPLLLRSEAPHCLRIKTLCEIQQVSQRASTSRQRMFCLTRTRKRMKRSQKMSPRRHLQGSAQDRFFFIHHKRGDVLLCVAYQGGSPPAHPGGSPPPPTSVQVKKKNSSWQDAAQREAFEEERQKRRLIFFVSGPSYKEMYMSPDHYKEMYMSPDLIQGDVYVS